jgi:hypothetical protein
MMKEWFKARNIWRGAFEALSDAEAGRLAKALWRYTTTGEQENLSGSEKAIFAMLIFTLQTDEKESAELSATRAASGSKGGKQKLANLANANFATEEVANLANVANKNKNKNKNKNIEREEENIENKENTLKSVKEKRERFSSPSIEDVEAYCQERGNGINAQAFVDFYSAKGWKIGNSPMKDWKAAVRTWETRERRPAARVASTNPFMDALQRGEFDDAI